MWVPLSWDLEPTGRRRQRVTGMYLSASQDKGTHSAAPSSHQPQNLVEQENGLRTKSGMTQPAYSSGLSPTSDFSEPLDLPCQFLKAVHN